MADNALTRLYRVMVQDTDSKPVVQRRILNVGANNNDSDMLATLATTAVLAADVDDAIGKRKGAKERAAWIGRKDRTPAEVRKALTSEKRVGVLQAAALRTDLTAADYAKLAKAGHVKVDVALLRNHVVPSDVKQQAASHWGRSVEADETGYRLREDLVSIFGPLPSTHNALGLNALSPSILHFVSKSTISEEVQLRIVERLVKPAAERVVRDVDSYGTASDFETACEAARFLARSGGTTAAVRAQLVTMLTQIGEIPKPKRYYGGDTCETVRKDTLKAIKVGATPQQVDPAEEAILTTDAAKLLEFAKAASSTQNSSLAQAVIANPHLTGDALSEVLNFIGWRGREQFLQDLIRRDDLSAFVVLATSGYGDINDDLLSKAKDPADVLRQIAHKMEEISSRSSAWLQLLSSRYCTPTVLVELPVAAIGHPEAPAAMALNVNEALVTAFGEDEAKWTLFEALVGDGQLPLREVIAAVHALS